MNISDLTALASQWQQTSQGFLSADLNHDGQVNISDLTMLASSWQATLPSGQPTAGTFPAEAPLPEVITRADLAAALESGSEIVLISPNSTALAAAIPDPAAAPQSATVPPAVAVPATAGQLTNDQAAGSLAAAHGLQDSGSDPTYLPLATGTTTVNGVNKLATRVDGGQTIVGLTFGSNQTGYGLLKDGNYFGDKVGNAATQVLPDADGEQRGGGRVCDAALSDDFFQLYGAAIGERMIDTLDFAYFRALRTVLRVTLDSCGTSIPVTMATSAISTSPNSTWGGQSSDPRSRHGL